MKFYNEPSKSIPVKNEVDVLVIGGGPAGFSAAVAAARNGARTVLVEQAGDVGGVATTGLMSHWAGRIDSSLYDELIERSNDIESCPEGQKASKFYINNEKLKTVMLEMLEEAKVILQLYTFASDVIMDYNILKGIIIESKSGREAIMAKIIIDASGDGDIAAKAGVPFYKGREDDGKMQPMTLMFKVGGVDYRRAVLPGSFETTVQLPQGDLQTLAKEHIPFPAGHVLLYATTSPGVVTCNMTNVIQVDGTNAEDLTYAEITCRKQMGDILKFLKEYVPGFEKCYIINSASIIGVRETRHFEGEYVLTKEDILEARVFNDWIVKGAYFNFDVHNLTGCGIDKTGAQKKFQTNKSYTIPYRCFVPQKVENLLLAGRNISGTHIAHSNYRVMPICMGMGHGVGTAAALCVKENIKPRELDVCKAQEILGRTPAKKG